MLGLATAIKSMLLQYVAGHSEEKTETQLNQVPHNMNLYINIQYIQHLSFLSLYNSNHKTRIHDTAKWTEPGHLPVVLLRHHRLHLRPEDKFSLRNVTILLN